MSYYLTAKCRNFAAHFETLIEIKWVDYMAVTLILFRTHLRDTLISKTTEIYVYRFNGYVIEIKIV